MYKLLSYPICKNMPTWPGSSSVDLTPNSSIDKGDVAYTYTIHLFNHYGTHFDAPLHFNKNGLPISELPLNTFIYNSPLLIDIPKQPGEKVEPADLEIFADKILNCDLLMIRTGFWKNRMEEPDVYEKNGPAISSRTAKWLLDNFLNIKAVALDFVSLASYSDQNDGNLAHQIMLGTFHQHYICIIEDVNMADLPADGICKVAAIPLFVEGVDSCPVTMWAEL